ncbi:MAG TPA: ABC transporter ATP-binding protein [Burkholderiaceae bacterium]|nr:ABC transporter ATP-binding protein [Burkholderiaceae bacterium]
MLDARGLHAAYGSARVLHGIDLQVRRGEVLALLGRNGMGKTTLVRSLMGIVAPTAGELTFAGTSILGWPAHRIARRGIALVPEGRQVFASLSVAEHLSAFTRRDAFGAAPWDAQRVFSLFPRLAERREQWAQQLSGGEQQMLAIGRALVTNPRLLILDEATEGLAPLVREEIWRALARLRQAGQAIVVIDKYVQRLIGLADRHVILEKGRVAWTGTSAALAAEPGLWHRYLGV